MNLRSSGFFRKCIAFAALLGAAYLFAQVEAPGNLYEGLENVSSYVKARNDYINQFLRDFENGKEELNTKGITQEENGTISFRVSQRPDLYNPVTALFELRIVTPEKYPAYEKALLERGFLRQDLDLLQSLLSCDTEKEISLLTWKLLWKSPLRPLVENLAARKPFTGEELQLWIDASMKYFNMAQVKWTVDFLEEMSVTSRRVLVSFCNEDQDTIAFLNGPKTKNTRVTEAYLKLFNKNMSANSEEVADILAGRNEL